MKAQFDDSTRKSVQETLKAQGATISKVRFGIAEIEFPEGTLSMEHKNIFGSLVTFYLLPDGETVAELKHGEMESIYLLKGEDASTRARQIKELARFAAIYAAQETS